MDVDWCRRLVDFCERDGIDFETAVEGLRESDTYLLAHSQFIAGASDRVVDGLLSRAAIEEGLITTAPNDERGG